MGFGVWSTLLTTQNRHDASAFPSGPPQKKIPERVLGGFHVLSCRSKQTTATSLRHHHSYLRNPDAVFGFLKGVYKVLGFRGYKGLGLEGVGVFGIRSEIQGFRVLGFLALGFW